MSNPINASISLVDGHGATHEVSAQMQQLRKISTGLILLSAALFAAALFGWRLGGWVGFFSVFGPITVGTIGHIVATYSGTVPGIKNNGTMTDGTKSRGTVGIILGVVITTLYVMLYWHGSSLSGAIALVEPLGKLLNGKGADQWFLYGTLYTFGVVLMGVRMIFRYRHNKYQIFRTLSVMFFQLGFGFLIPQFLKLMSQPEFYFTYFWPLKYNYLFPNDIKWLMEQPGGLGTFMVFWGIAASFILTPLLTWYFGKRWYCSWVCGCGGLAETAGDPFRHLSDKSIKAWRFERWAIHLVLVSITVVTLVIWINSYTEGKVLGDFSQAASKTYGFLVGAMLSGVVGVGFYPLMGSRVWCRFFCPMAAILGLGQRFFSRFRITTNGGQCISCGNCSTYCEMGIDVRKYAQKGENIVRASCVGCGICAAVCPRGVLKLENGKVSDRFDGADAPLSELIKSLKS
ncbi:MAG: 4Fe-4S binding protein [Bradymonadia bacterium]